LIPKWQARTMKDGLYHFGPRRLSPEQARIDWETLARHIHGEFLPL
jgi:hypothetical protein